MHASVAARHTAILEILSSEGFANIRRLQQELGCSEATLRRDLEQLKRAGRLQRTHGGAMVDGAREVPFALKLGTMAEAKRRIARAAAGLVEGHPAVGLTGGTTTQQVARHLGRHAGLTVVTNALTVAMELAKSEVRVIVTGGELRGQTYELVGPLAEPVLTHVHLDLVFVGVDGLSVEGGLTTHNPIEARINRVLLDRASRVVVVTDHTKLGRKTFAQIAPIGTIDVLVTDAEADADYLNTLRQSDVEVITA